jgi:hypothetical protein
MHTTTLRFETEMVYAPLGGKMMRPRRRSGLLRLAACVTVSGAIAMPMMSQTRSAMIENEDIHIQLAEGAEQPAIVLFAGSETASGTWHNRDAETLPSLIDSDGVSKRVVWKSMPALATIKPRLVEFVYESDAPHLRLRWRWVARSAHGAIEHSVAIENLGEHELWLPMVDSLELNLQVAKETPLQHFYVEKGADTPSAEGTHLLPISDGYSWIGRSSTYARPIAGQAREIIPVEYVFAPASSSAGWYAGIEFSGRTRIQLSRKDETVSTTLGLNPDPGPYRTRLSAHGSFETPTIFLGCFHAGLDESSNQLKSWVRDVLTNPKTWQDPQYPLTVSNSWGSGMQVDETLAIRMMADARDLGLEMFHLDAGWFRGVGDWYRDPKKFPHGLGFLSVEAHQLGLRFGLWVDWTQAGVSTNPGALNVHDPHVKDWLLNDLPADWKPEEFKGETTDIGAPEAKAYAAKEVKRIVEDYHLDMLEHDGYLVAQGCTREDHPHAPPVHSTQHIDHDSGFDFVVASNSTDVSYHATRAYYSIYEQLRKEHPGLLFEICNDGGRMVDFGSAAHGDYFSITDTYDPLSNRRAFYDASYALPSAMLESYVEKWPTPGIGQFRYMLRSGMMGWMTLMLDTTQWNAEQRQSALTGIALYKQKLRPLIRDAHLFHVSDRPDGVHWDGIEYWDPLRKQGVLFAFRGTAPDSPTHAFILAGLDPVKRYRLHFEDGSSADRSATGEELMQSGLLVKLSEPISSELVFLSEETTSPASTQD